MAGANTLPFYPAGEIHVPVDYLSQLTEEEWSRAYSRIPRLEENKLAIEEILDDVRGLVQEQSDLLHNPYRTSENPEEQDKYWELYFSYYNDVFLAFRQIFWELDKFWRNDFAKALALYHKKYIKPA